MILDLLDRRHGNVSNTPSSKSESQPNNHLRILDLCTGTGCIPLLLHAILSNKISQLYILGVDISPAAISLAKRNLHHNVSKGLLPSAAREQIQFVTEDIFQDSGTVVGEWDIVISNPPYISPQGFNKTTSRPVRKYEPKIALVPSYNHHADYFTKQYTKPNEDTRIGDSFYPQILEIAAHRHAQCVLVEVADLNQAKRVAAMGIRSGNWAKCEIWRDWLDEQRISSDETTTTTSILGVSVRIIGEGNGRSVLFGKNKKELLNG